MKECNTKPIQFSPVNRRQVTAEFNGGRITTDTGILLLREVDRRTGLLDSINDSIPDPRDPRNTVHQRVIMKAERLAEDPNRRFIVSSLTGDQPKHLYDDAHTQRGDMENRIKKQPFMLFVDRTNCHDFQANQLRLLLSSFACVLLHELRESHLGNTDLEKAQVKRIRLVLLKITARVTVSVLRVVLHVSSSCPYQRLFRRVVATPISAPG